MDTIKYLNGTPLESNNGLLYKRLAQILKISKREEPGKNNWGGGNQKGGGGKIFRNKGGTQLFVEFRYRKGQKW